jgi:antitoxin component YwqK of YwqJK toxin-antitoxin module
MYQTGEISLVAKKCSLKVYEIGEVLQYAFSGEIITYYRNGNKRSCYNLDSLGSINGKLLIYDTNGKVIYSMEYVNNMIYNGYYISKLSNQEIYLAYFEKGLKKKEYMFKEGKLLKYKKGSFRDFFYKKHLKQFNRLFHICDDYVQFSPGGRLM